jgi:hypothetical protein
MFGKNNPEPWDFVLVLNKYLRELGICAGRFLDIW